MAIVNKTFKSFLSWTLKPSRWWWIPHLGFKSPMTAKRELPCDRRNLLTKTTWQSLLTPSLILNVLTLGSCRIGPQESAVLQVVSPQGTTDPEGLKELAPKVALLERRVGGESSFCTGTLIKANMILTAAHCLVDSQGRLLKTKSIRAGLRLSAQEPWIYHAVEALSINPRYRAGQSWKTGVIKNFDLGIMILASAVGGAFTKNLPTVIVSSEELKKLGIPGGTFSFVGYGGVGLGGPQMIGQGVGQAHGIQQCSGSIQSFLREHHPEMADLTISWPTMAADQVGMFCLMTQKNRSYTEHGDSGGPAYVRHQGGFSIVGVTSAGNSGRSRSETTISAFETLDDRTTAQWFQEIYRDKSRPCTIQ